MLLFVDLESGEIESQAVRSLPVEGSYSSKLMVRSDGCRVEVSGNPSRWGVRHSLDGFTDLADCVELYNTILRMYGLPEFTHQVGDVHLVNLRHRNLQGSDGALAKDHGMRITRIDLALLYQTGGAGECATAVRALGQVTHQGKAPMVYGKGETVMWGGKGSRHIAVKYYAKGPEMRKHGKDVDLVAQWANEVGLLRHEVTLKSMWLTKNGLEKPEAWTTDTARRISEKYSMHLKVGVARSSYAEIYEELLHLDVPPGRARRAQEAAFAYLAGHVFLMGENIPKTSYYRLRADLRRVGLDISAPLNVSALRNTVRVVDLCPVVIPAAFRRAG